MHWCYSFPQKKTDQGERKAQAERHSFLPLAFGRLQVSGSPALDSELMNRPNGPQVFVCECEAPGKSSDFPCSPGGL